MPGASSSFWARAAVQPEAGPYRVLVLGKDDASGLCDVIILASFDSETGKVCLAQIPRDTYFRYTEKNYKKINGAVDTLGSPDKLCRVLGDALAVEIRDYLLLDLECVKSAVDIIGGVTLNIPCDMDYDDPAQGLSIHLRKGKQTLTGEQAASFIRYRSGYLRADIGRIDAQKLFLAAFFDSASREVRGEDIPELAMLAMKSVKTNMSVVQMVSVLKRALAVSPENITLLTLPGEEIQSEYSGAWYYVLSRRGTAKVMEEQFGVLGASSCFDPAHLFSDAGRPAFERIYRMDIEPQYYTVDGLSGEGIEFDE